jgi:hypothetical protein
MERKERIIRFLSQQPPYVVNEEGIGWFDPYGCHVLGTTLDEIDDDDLETVCAHSHTIASLMLGIYNLNKSKRSLIRECDTSQRVTGKT